MLRVNQTFQASNAHVKYLHENAVLLQHELFQHTTVVEPNKSKLAKLPKLARANLHLTL